MREVSESGGGALQKKVSMPKNTHEEADKKFLASLDNREMELKKIYDEMSKTKDGARLI